MPGTGFEIPMDDIETNELRRAVDSYLDERDTYEEQKRELAETEERMKSARAALVMLLDRRNLQSFKFNDGLHVVRAVRRYFGVVAEYKTQVLTWLKRRKFGPSLTINPRTLRGIINGYIENGKLSIDEETKLVQGLKVGGMDVPGIRFHSEPSVRIHRDRGGEK